MKSPAIIAMLLILAAAASAATVTITPAQLYEATNQKVWLEIDNYNGTSVITSVILSTELNITEAEEYNGWNTTHTKKQARWTGGTIETNVKKAWFGIEAELPKVDQNEETTLDVTFGESAEINLTILNDATPPEISNAKPSGYAAANQSDVPVSATIIDAETGIKTASYKWSDCNGPSTTITLEQSGDTFSGNASFTGTTEGSTACYEFTATNNGGETATLNGTLTFDGTAPTVALNSPLNTATELTNFSFTAADNIAEELECELKLGNKSLANLTAQNGTETVIEQDLSGFSDGTETWKVKCRDGVGLEAESSQQIMLDTQAPTISENAPTAIPRTQEVSFTATVTDIGGVSSVEASFSGETVNLTKSGDNYTGSISGDTLGDYNLTITAEDNAGHLSTYTKQISVVKNHQVGLALSPSTTTKGKEVKAWGSITADGNLSNTTILLELPGETRVLNLTGNSYSTKLDAPSQGSYTITAEYQENGITYRTDATLTVQSSTSSIQNQIEGSHGQGFDAWRYSGSIVQDDEMQTEDESSNSEQTEEEQEQEKEPAYEPIEPDEPRQALTPKATGIFTLGNVINWLAVLLALALMTVLAVYAYKKRKPKDPWERYFGR